MSTTVTVRMDDELKAQTEAVLDSIGMNMTTAVTVFAKAVVRQGGLPFPLVGDHFYSPANQARLRAAADHIDQGRPLVAKSMTELEEFADA
jgi:DNA-damage-inducible protein J